MAGSGPRTVPKNLGQPYMLEEMPFPVSVRDDDLDPVTMCNKMVIGHVILWHATEFVFNFLAFFQH